MGKRLAPDVDARIVALRDAHRTEAQIAAILTREGVAITASGVHRALGRLGRAKPRKGAKASAAAPAGPVAAPAPRRRPVAPAPPPEPAAPELEAAETEDDVATRLRRVLASLERVAGQAEEERDVARVVAAQRAITQAAALLAKATPPAPVQVDERPDMLAAAQRGRERIQALLKRALGGGAS